MIIAGARTVPGSPLAGADGDAVIDAGIVTFGARSAAIGTIAAAIAGNGLEARGKVVGMPDNPAYRSFSQHGFGAHFADVGVDMDTGEVRLRRMIGAFAVCEVLNPKTFRSHLIGGMIWGVSSALLEDAVVDPRFGQFVNNELAG